MNRTSFRTVLDAMVVEVNEGADPFSPSTEVNAHDVV